MKVRGIVRIFVRKSPLLEIQPKRPKLIAAIRGAADFGIRAAQQSFQPSEKLHHGKRLCHIVVGAPTLRPRTRSGTEANTVSMMIGVVMP